MHMFTDIFRIRAHISSFRLEKLLMPLKVSSLPTGLDHYLSPSIQRASIVLLNYFLFTCNI